MQTQFHIIKHYLNKIHTFCKPLSEHMLGAF